MSTIISLRRAASGVWSAVRELSGRAAFFRMRRRCRYGAMGVPIADNLILCRALDAFKLVVSATDESLGLNLIADGYWEPNVTRLIHHRVHPGMVCVDAGANLGYFTILMASLAGAAGKVYAAEPIPETRDLLVRNLRLNGFEGRVEVLATALGASASTVRMIVPKGEPKNAAISAGELTGGGNEVLVSVASLDSFQIPFIDLIKIDVEGAEIAVWDGMQATIDRSPNIQILLEVNPDRYTDPAGFLEGIERRFPLRAIDGFGNLTTTSIAQILASTSDVMLYLSRR